MTLDSYDSSEAQALLCVPAQRIDERPSKRERLTHAVRAGGFLLAAGLLAALAPWHRSLSLTSAALLIGIYLLAQRVRFPASDGWTAPSELVIVPMLFLLPTPLVPLTVAVAIVISRLLDAARGRARVSMLPAFVGDAWFSVGPALVIVLGSAQGFAWSHWPIYLAALAAQLLFDLLATVPSVWLASGVKPSVQLPLLSWIYVVDAALAPAGLAITAAAVVHPPLVLLAVPLIAMLSLLARERRRRLEDATLLSSAYRGISLLLAEIIEADEHYTGQHSRDVVELSLAIADDLGIDQRARQQLELAALLHDIGKVRVPTKILNKAGALDEHERALLARHPVDGAEMLAPVGGSIAGVGEIVRATHEHFDGTGYPSALSGEQIPIQARIICAADAYSAMTHDRPYRSAMSTADALLELRRGSGAQFDPMVVEVVERLLAAAPSTEDWLALLGSAPAPPPSVEVVLAALRDRVASEPARAGAPSLTASATVSAAPS